MKTFQFLCLAGLLSINSFFSQSPQEPSWPSAARDRGLSGTVVVKVEIDESGKVISATDMCQGPPYLSESTVKAAREARFAPVKLDGQPVKGKGRIQYHFVDNSGRR